MEVVDHKARIDTIGVAIAKRHMEAPVLFFLEMHRPLSGLCDSFITAFAPLVSPLVGRDWLETIQYLLQTPSELERFMKRLEQNGFSGESYGRN